MGPFTVYNAENIDDTAAPAGTEAAGTEPAGTEAAGTEATGTTTG
jgi:hypothetical protein